MTKSQLKLLFLFIGVSAYFFAVRIIEHQQKHIVATQVSLAPTTQLKPKEGLDFRLLSRDLIEYSSTSNDVLKQKWFPWWFRRQAGHDSKQYMEKEDTSKGIVICTGNTHFHLALVALAALKLVGNELPIEVAFSTSNDLSSRNRQELETVFPKIELVDLSLTVFNDSYLKLRGWEIKPFAVLASQFRHVLLMDADVLFLERPSILFQNTYYLKTGSLFFYDRVALSENAIRWVRAFVTDNSNQSLPKRAQESGVVLIDKSRVLAGLLSICKLNEHEEREKSTYRHLHGDKDTWWLGFHLIQMPYSFVPTLTGSIGELKNNGRNNTVCGHILHLDENHRPMWWNGGMFRNRYVDVKQLLAIEGWVEEGQWDIRKYSCVINDKETVKRFSRQQEQLISGYLEITRKIFNISVVDLFRPGIGSVRVSLRPNQTEKIVKRSEPI